ncbi:MAG: hypothetical protein JW724_03900 [Candidatus Altiarchaeota archaeon]|nr:hypothetical protein [Candidatus Altiarchaeota archaeon]
MTIQDGTFLERRSKKLSFAVHLSDDYSKGLPLGKIEVFLDDGRRAAKNASSYYLFLDLPEDEYRVQVRSEHYFDETSEPLSTEAYNNKNPLNINLMPRPSYPFLPGETLVRGLLLDGDERPISGGRLGGHAANKDFSSRTTETGEFVIYFGTLSEEDVVEEAGRYFIRGDTDAKIKISIGWAGRSREMELEEVEVGMTRSITVLFNSL